MIISGVVVTSTGVIGDHIVAPSAIDCSARPPLFLEHRRPVGQILHLQVVGGKLLATAETDDPEAMTLGFFSPAGRAVERRRRDDGLWDVTRFKLQEISVVRSPQNPAAVITDRRARDPVYELHKTRLREIDLFKEAFGTIAKRLQAVATVYGEAR